MIARGRPSPRDAPRVAPGWAEWSPRAREAPWTLGVEEEVMLLDAATGRLSWRGDDVLALLPEELQSQAAAETHACAVELATEPHATVAAAVGQLGALRA